ncbi:MAG: Gfo/Idh/MocA family oxidoreductase [Cyclobacteriaceae bacterium]|jgi:scyllo-inositol 2-dehydrogenase (NADP+)|nr:Gfo/Idh/MocA family oxidoreductase [Cyclobacteriaceae bacterium]
MSLKPIKTAILSYGMSGEVFHAPLIHAHPGFELSVVLQRSKQSAEAHYPNCRVVRTFEEVLSDPSVELVVVNTPNHLHLEQAAKSLQAGKHVIVEKPFTVTVQEANELIDLADKHNKILTVFQSRRLDGDFLTLKKVIDNKWVGKIVEFEAHYDRFRNYIEPNSWKEEAGPGKGILYNLGSHMLDQVLVLFGMPSEIDARIGIQRPGGSVDDFYDLRLTYPGLNVIVKSSYLVREQGPRYQLHGTEGSFVTSSNVDPQEQALKEKKIPGTSGWGTLPKECWGRLNTTINGLHVEGKVETIPGNYLKFYQNIYEVIREGKSLDVKPEESREVIRLIEAAYESNRTRRSVILKA